MSMAIPRTLRPGLWVFGMTFVWVFPFFVLNVTHLDIPASEVWPSIAFYVLVLGVALGSSIAMCAVEYLAHIWERMWFLLRYVYAVGVYALNLFVILAVQGRIEWYLGFRFKYFGADPEGSFMMLYFPTAVVYAVVGMVVAIPWTAVELMRFFSKRRLASSGQCGAQRRDDPN